MKKLMLALKLGALHSIGISALTAQNLIDLTYGIGAGSFERGDFNNTDLDSRPNLMLVSSSMSNITGWTATGSLGVHWINFGSISTTEGTKNLDLQGLNPPGSLSSISTTVPTTLGATYRLRFDAYSGNSPNSAVVSIGSLANQTFSGGNGEFLKQNFVSYSFPFTATATTSTLAFQVTASNGFGPVVDNVSIALESPLPLPPQKIFLAFDQPSSFKLIVVPLAFGRSWPIVEPFSSMRAATVDATYRASVTAQVKSIFLRSGVTNIDWVTADSDDAVAVYFCPLINPDILGYSRGAPDRFNSKRRGEVIVFVNESSPLASLDAESAAHEIGHSLGLRHVDPSAADPLDNEVMDLDFSSEPQFTNTISDITDITSFATHNPRYHLLRYIDGWSPTQLQNEGVEPGTWDSGTSIFTKLSFQGANLRLHNITLYASGGDVESTFVLEQISSATLSELSQRSFAIPKGMKVTLLASSAEGGAPDVISATGDPFVGENQHVAVDAATTQFSLYRQDSPTVAVPIASATAESDLTTPYCNLSLTPPNILRLDFRGTLQRSSNLSDWTDIGLDTTSPQFITIPLGQEAGFFRSMQPATP